MARASAVLKVVESSPAAAKKPGTRIVPIGKQIDELDKLRDDLREASAKEKAAKALYDAAAAALLERLDKEEMPSASGSAATISRSIVVVANWDGVDGFDKLTAWIKKTGHFELFQRRISDPAFRELAALTKGGVPGLVPFTKITLNHSSKKKEVA